MLAFLDSSNAMNAMYLVFAKRLGLTIRATNVGAQKINGTTFETYGILVAAFSVINQADRIRFFKVTFLIANVSSNVILGMPFLTLSDADVDFPKRKL